MLNIVLIAPWDFMQKTRGDHNRALGLANAMSKIANVTVVHQGPNVKVDRTRFFHYDPLSRGRKRESLAGNVVNCYTSSIATSIGKLVQNIASTEEIDVLQVEQPFPFCPALNARDSLNKAIVLSLDNHNVYFPFPKLKLGRNFIYSVYSALNLPYIKSMERLAVMKSDIVLCVSNRDAGLLRQLYDLEPDKVCVVSNGVDVESFEKAYPKTYKGFKSRIVFFHGTLSWYPNMEAVDIISDYIAPKIPDATFLICGSNPALTVLKKISKSENVKYLGYVDQLPEYIKGSDLCIAPLTSGGGTKLKLLEYAAAGKPIIATRKAAEGLPFVDEYNALLYDKVDSRFIDGVKRIMYDEKLGMQIGQNAREMAQKYDWNGIGRRLVEFYEGYVGK